MSLLNILGNGLSLLSARRIGLGLGAAICLQVFSPAALVADPVLVDSAITQNTARDGQTVTLRYRIQSSTSRQVWLGTELQAPNGVRVHEYGSSPALVNINAGTNWYERSYLINLPHNANFGSYNVTWDVRWGASGHDSRTQPNALQIQQPVPVDAPILMYHKVGDVAHSRFWVSTAQLEAQIRALKQRGYTFVTLQDLMDYRAGIRPAPAKPVVLTFDDGYQDLLTHVHPIVSKSDLRVPVTVFLNPGLMGQTNRWDTGIDFNEEPEVRHLTWDETRTLHNTGLFDFQSHTMTHINLLTHPDTREQELIDSRVAIEQQLNKRVRFFSHPYGAGATHDTIKELLHRTGYFAAAGIGSAPETQAREKYSLRRHDIHWQVTTEYDPAQPQNYLFGPNLLNDSNNNVSDFHPADTNQDWIITVGEVAAYASKWRQGGEPLGYVTRAAYLWRSGGNYRHDPQIGSKPASWVER